MFLKEASGLLELRQAKGVKIPEVYATGKFEIFQYLIMEFLKTGSPRPSFWKNFAEGLAIIHQVTKAYYGLKEDNYIGILKQQNTPHNTWAAFYAENRIMPLIIAAENTHKLSRVERIAAEKLCKRLPNYIPDSGPSLLHGDLWAGNFLVTKEGLPAIYDPAPYYGNREMDIAMSLLFGGFDKQFYSLYEEIFPMEKNFRQRIRLYQLYPLLVHLNLFGSGYFMQVKEILEAYK